MSGRRTIAGNLGKGGKVNIGHGQREGSAEHREPTRPGRRVAESGAEQLLVCERAVDTNHCLRPIMFVISTIGATPSHRRNPGAPLRAHEGASAATPGPPFNPSANHGHDSAASRTGSEADWLVFHRSKVSGSPASSSAAVAPSTPFSRIHPARMSLVDRTNEIKPRPLTRGATRML